MKTIKYILCFFIFSIGMLIIGESQIFRLDNFYTPYYYTTLYLQYGQNEEDMIQDTLEAAKKSNVEVFTYVKTVGGNKTDMKVFGSSGVEKYLNQDLDIYSEEYKSIFLGNMKFSFHSLESLQGIKDVHDFYVIGNSQEAEHFKSQLINIYAGNFPQEGYKSNDTQITTSAIWILMIGITLLLTYYDIVYQRKENLIRVSMGESISTIMWKRIGIDGVVFFLIYFFILIMLENYTSVMLQLHISIIGFISLLVLNSLVYSSLRFYHIKEVFSNAKGSTKKLLSLNYGLKIITVILTIFVISSNLVLIFESYSVFKQKGFFEEHADYSYITTRYRPQMTENGLGDPKFEETETLQAQFYNAYFTKSNATLLSMVHSPLNIPVTAIMANQNTLTYLTKNINELSRYSINKDVYFILPDYLSKNDQLISELKNEFIFFEGKDLQDNYEVIYYSDEVDLVAINANHIYGSEIFNNPIVIFNNTSPESQPLNYEPNRVNYISEIMYSISDEEFEQFLLENELTETNAVIDKTNVMDKYNESWKAAKRILYMNSVFSLLILFLECMIITSIIKLEYEVNAIELSIKKVFGYSIYEKNKKIILMTVISTIGSIILTVTSAYLLGLNSAPYLVYGGLIILVSELLIIYLYMLDCQAKCDSSSMSAS